MKAARALAVLEVVAATALVVAAYKALKLVEPAGGNLAPGAVMILAASAFAVLRRGSGVDYGLWGPSSGLGIQLGVLLSAALLPLALVDILVESAKLQPAPYVIAAVPLGAAALVLARRGGDLRRIPSRYGIAALASLVVLLASLALAAGLPPRTAATTLAGRLIFTGFGEELFFRGYVLSRLDGAFGRPYRLLGAAWGPGLLLSAALFASIHVLNPARPFQGQWDFAWTWGAATLASGCILAWLRERTGSLWPGVVLHGVLGAARGLAIAWMATQP